MDQGVADLGKSVTRFCNGCRPRSSGGATPGGEPRADQQLVWRRQPVERSRVCWRQRPFDELVGEGLRGEGGEQQHGASGIRGDGARAFICVFMLWNNEPGEVILELDVEGRSVASRGKAPPAPASDKLTTDSPSAGSIGIVTRLRGLDWAPLGTKRLQKCDGSSWASPSWPVKPHDLQGLSSAPCWARTSDLRLVEPALSQLS